MTVIGPVQRYQPSERLSEDVLGTLWRGRDVRSGSTVTIRLLDERLTSDPRAVHRATVQLRWAQWEAGNPHLARVLDVRLGPEDQPAFVVSEGSSGGSLLQHLMRGQAFTVGRAMRVVAAVADGLASAHASWVYHGALTPASILMDDDVAAKVMDIGLQELLDSRDDHGSTGRASSLTDRGATDVLAVARVFERLLATTEREAGVRSDLARTRDSEISSELGDLVNRALSPHRLQRPRMADLAAALASELDGFPLQEGIEHEDLPSPAGDIREQVSGGDASDGDVSEPSVVRGMPMVPAIAPAEPAAVEPAAVEPAAAEPPLVEPPLVEPPPAAPPLVEPPPAAPPLVEPPPLEAPPLEPAAAEALLAEATPAEAPPPERPAAERPAAERPAAERPAAEGATRPPKRARFSRPRLPVVLGASVLVLGLIVGGFVASRDTDAGDDVGDPVRPILTPPALSEPPSAEPIVPATVPTMLGQPLERATNLVEGAGLVVGSVIPIRGEEGIVVRTDPTQGEAVPAGTVVDIFVGSGAG